MKCVCNKEGGCCGEGNEVTMVGGWSVNQDLSPIDFLSAFFIAFLCCICGQLMVQPVFRGDEGDRQ